jgi:hypothetical protein
MADDPPLGPKAAGHPGVSVGIGIVVAMAAIAFMMRELGVQAPERAAGGEWGSVSFPLLVATPAVLAEIGTRRRPWILAAAGTVLFPMCFLSFSFLFFPFVVPAGLFVGDASVRPRARPRPKSQCAAAVLSVLFVVAAALSLWAHRDPVTWHTAMQSGYASDVITPEEALTSFGFLVAAIAVAALAPPDGPRATRPAR